MICTGGAKGKGEREEGEGEGQRTHHINGRGEVIRLRHRIARCPQRAAVVLSKHHHSRSVPSFSYIDDGEDGRNSQDRHYPSSPVPGRST